MKMTPPTQCFLRNVENDTKIDLPHNIKVSIGRNCLTSIKNPFVSKDQLVCTADWTKFEVLVEWIGNNMSGINGYALKKGVTYHLTHKDRIEILLRSLIHEIVFHPPPPLKEADQNESSVPSKKRSSGSILKHFGKQQCMEFNWERLHNGQLHVMNCNELQPSEKIGGYDFDGTIVKTKSGRVFPKDMDDWLILYPEIPHKLKSLRADGYKIVIFTNQAGIGNGKVLLKDFKSKLERVVSKLGVPIEAYVSTSRTYYRKPAPGMWEEMLKRNGNISVDKKLSFYCGDAAGRPANWMPKAKKDHSLADRLFALNIGLQFHTPEEHFLKQAVAEYVKPQFDPNDPPSETTLSDTDLVSTKQEILMLVGLPASGKSFVCKKYLIPAGYTWVNRDTLKTTANCMQAIEAAITAKRSVVLDNTNIDIKSRQPFIELAKRHSIPIRCGVMNISLDQCRHNSFFRELTDSSHSVITSHLIATYKDKFQEPTKEEGFTKVFKINFIASFTDDELQRLYKSHLIEK